MEPGTRKLVAIMFSDIAGYTALMGEDEEIAIRALEQPPIGGLGNSRFRR